MKTTSLFVLLLTGIIAPKWTNAQELPPDSTMATIYFYRVHSVKGIVVSFNLHHNDSVIGRISSGSVVVYQSPPGIQEFWSGTESKRSIFIDLKGGKTYFVRCRIALGTVAGVPSFRQVGPDDAISRITELLQEEKRTDEVTSLHHRRAFVAAQSNQDTLRAVNNLFERKRKGGKTRGSIFLVIGLGGVVASLANDDPGGLAAVPAVAIIAITGFTQSAKYKSENLQKVLTDYVNEKTLPEKIKGKLKPKDFAW